MHARRVVLAATSIVLLAAVLGQGPGTAAEEQKGRTLGEGVKSATIHRDDGSGKPGEELAQVSPSDHILHFRVEMDRRREGPVAAKWVFTSVDTSAGKDLKLGENTLNGNGYSKISGTLRGYGDWPAGTYHTDLYVNDKLVQVFDYVCAGPATPASAQPVAPSVSPK